MITLKIASIGSFLAGISHLTLQAYDHQSIPLYLVGFIVAGILQILWAVIAWRGKLSPFWFWFGTLLNLGAVTFWFITRIMPAPLIGEKEHFSLLGYSVAFLEIVAVIGALIHKRNGLYWVLVPILGIGSAFGAYYAGIEVEHQFPNLKVQGGHHGGGHHKSKSSSQGGGHHGEMMNHQKKNTESDDHHGTDNNTVPATNHAEDKDDGHHGDNTDSQKMKKHDDSDDHHKGEEKHDHADCGDGACPLEDDHTESNETEKPVEEESTDEPTDSGETPTPEPVVEVQAEVEVEAHVETDTNEEDDHHDEPHGH